MFQVLSRWLPLLSLVCFLSTPVLAQETEKHEGKIITVSENKFVMQTPDGKTMTHTLTANAKITADGKPARFADLKAGMQVQVTTLTTDKNAATEVVATSTKSDGSGRAYLGIRGENANGSGILVRDVDPNGPAATAGLRNGDVIKAISETEVRDFGQLQNALSQRQAGDKINLSIQRQDKEQKLDVTLGRLQEAARQPEPNRPLAYLGVTVGPWTPEDRRRLNMDIENGVLLLEIVPGSPAEKAGLQKDDVLTAVNNNAITDPRQLWQAVQQVGAGQVAVLRVMRNGQTREVKATLEQAPAETPIRR